MTEIEPAIAGLPAVFVPGRREDRNPYLVYLARFSGESLTTMRGCLDRIAAIITGRPAECGLGGNLPWEQIRYPHVVRLCTKFGENEKWTSPSHINKHLSALRGVLKECWRLGLMSAEDYQRARDVPNVKGTREPAGRSIRADEIARLLAACLGGESSLCGIRDAALIAVLQSTGLRRAELAGALIERYDHGERSLKVLGKGNKERTVYIHPDAAAYLERWLACLGERRGPVFRPVNKRGVIGSTALSLAGVAWIVTERRKEAGLDHLSTHDFRRTFIGDFIDAGGDLAQAQKLAGHASATTTAAYDRRPGRALRAGVDRMHLPSPGDLAGPRTAPDRA